MKVLIHQVGRFLTKDKTLDDFIFSTITEMCKTHAGQEFIWLSYDNTSPLINIDPARRIVLKAPAFVVLWKQVWLSKQLASIIKSQKPAYILCIDGRPIKTNVPQSVLITQFDDKLISRLSANTRIITLSGYLKQLLVEKGRDPERIQVIRPKASKLFFPADWDTREGIKKKYAGDNEYFFFSANNTSPGRVVNVLKAFSLFKKWQKSNTRLLIYEEDPIISIKWKKLLPSYKFRDHVIVQDTVSEETRALITACAMCVLYFPQHDDTGLYLLGCLQGHVPVITHSIGAIPETVEDAALYCSEDIEDIADKMKKIYRDEKLRTQLINKIVDKADSNNNSSPSEQLWTVINDVS